MLLLLISFVFSSDSDLSRTTDTDTSATISTTSLSTAGDTRGSETRFGDFETVAVDEDQETQPDGTFVVYQSTPRFLGRLRSVLPSPQRMAVWINGGLYASFTFNRRNGYFIQDEEGKPQAVFWRDSWFNPIAIDTQFIVEALQQGTIPPVIILYPAGQRPRCIDTAHALSTLADRTLYTTRKAAEAAQATAVAVAQSQVVQDAAAAVRRTVMPAPLTPPTQKDEE